MQTRRLSSLKSRPFLGVKIHSCAVEIYDHCHCRKIIELSWSSSRINCKNTWSLKKNGTCTVNLHNTKVRTWFACIRDLAETHRNWSSVKSFDTVLHLGLKSQTCKSSVLKFRKFNNFGHCKEIFPIVVSVLRLYGLWIRLRPIWEWERALHSHHIHSSVIKIWNRKSMQGQHCAGSVAF